MVSASIVATLLAYAGYLLAIDLTGQIEQVRVFTHLPPDFVALNCAILAAFLISFLLSGWIVSRLGKDTFAQPKPVGGIIAPLLTGVVLVNVSADGWWLFTPYPQNKGMFQLVPLGGAAAVANLLVLIGFNRALGARRNVCLAHTAFWAVVAHYVLAGDRGSLLFLLVGAYGFHLARLPHLGWRVAVQSVLLAVVLLLALDQISYLRSWGQQAPTADGNFLAEIDLLPQSVAHMFHAISIQMSGYRAFPGGAVELLMTLWVQIVPSGLLRALGITLYNGPLLLSDFVVHGGGFFVPAELYFAGGFPAVILIAAYFGALASWLDRLAVRREDTLMITVTLLVAASSFYTMYYGVQAVNRMLTLPVVVLVGRSLLRDSIRRVKAERAW